MDNKRVYAIAALVMLITTALACRQQQPAVTPRAAGTFSIKGSVREMVIQPETPTFPEHEGKAEFSSYCGICHSLRYISTQPAFPRKTWEAEVHKMVEKYKAPVDSVTAGKIVDYLVFIKGKS
jgi:mono/diheme cytochrome c family protein